MFIREIFSGGDEEMMLQEMMLQVALYWLMSRKPVPEGFYNQTNMEETPTVTELLLD